MVILSQQYEWAEKRVDPVKKKALGGASDAVQTWPRIAVRDVLRAWSPSRSGSTGSPSRRTLVVADRRAVVAVRRWPPGITLVLSGMFAIGLIIYSYRRFRGAPYEEDED